MSSRVRMRSACVSMVILPPMKRSLGRIDRFEARLAFEERSCGTCRPLAKGDWMKTERGRGTPEAVLRPSCGSPPLSCPPPFLGLSKVGLTGLADDRGPVRSRAETVFGASLKNG